MNLQQQALVSVVIPVFNCEDRIVQCVNSVLNQTYRNIEVIIIDDGSTDKSSEILKKEISDKRIRFFSQENHGVSYTRNRGINLAKGKWVSFVDADDYIEKNTIEKMLPPPYDSSYSSIQENSSIREPDLIACGFRRLTESKEEFNNNCTGEKLLIQNIDALNLLMDTFSGRKSNGVYLGRVAFTLFRLELIKDIRFNEKLDSGEDTLFMIQCLKKCKLVLTISEPLYSWWTKPNSLSSSNSIESVFRFVESCRYLWPEMYGILNKNQQQTSFAYWIIDYFDRFLNRSAKFKLSYKEIKKLSNILFSNKEIIIFVFKQKINIRNFPSKLLLYCRSSAITFAVIKIITLFMRY